MKPLFFVHGLNQPNAETVVIVVGAISELLWMNAAPVMVSFKGRGARFVPMALANQNSIAL